MPTPAAISRIRKKMMNARPRPRVAGGSGFLSQGRGEAGEAGGALVVVLMVDSGLNSAQQIGKVGFGLSHGAGQRDASQVESKQPGNVIALGAGDLFLRLDHFHGGGDPRVKSIARLAQSFVGEAAIVFRQPNFADGGLQFDQSRADFLFDAARVDRRARPGADAAWLRPVRYRLSRGRLGRPARSRRQPPNTRRDW